MDGRAVDGFLLDGFLGRVSAALAVLFQRLGIDDALAQKVAVVTVATLAGYHVCKRLAKVGYRVNDQVGMAVEVVVLGAAFTFVAIAVPAWVSIHNPPTLDALLARLSG